LPFENYDQKVGGGRTNTLLAPNVKVGRPVSSCCAYAPWWPSSPPVRYKIFHKFGQSCSPQWERIIHSDSTEDIYNSMSLTPS